MPGHAAWTVGRSLGRLLPSPGSWSAGPFSDVSLLLPLLPARPLNPAVTLPHVGLALRLEVVTVLERR